MRVFQSLVVTLEFLLDLADVLRGVLAYPVTIEPLFDCFVDYEFLEDKIGGVNMSAILVAAGVVEGEVEGPPKGHCAQEGTVPSHIKIIMISQPV